MTTLRLKKLIKSRAVAASPKSFKCALGDRDCALHAQ
jgi:hypothetical protein